MELHLEVQAAGLALGFACGLVLALLYDMMSPPRRAAGRFSPVFDAFYALCVLAALFTLSMSLPSGRPGLWELTAAALAFGLYMCLLSPLISPIFGRIFRILADNCKKIRKYIGKVSNLFFQKDK